MREPCQLLGRQFALNFPYHPPGAENIGHPLKHAVLLGHIRGYSCVTPTMIMGLAIVFIHQHMLDRNYEGNWIVAYWHCRGADVSDQLVRVRSAKLERRLLLVAFGVGLIALLSYTNKPSSNLWP